MVEFWRTSGLDSDFNNKLQEIYSHFLEYIIDIIKGIKNNEFKNVDPRITALSILVNIEESIGLPYLTNQVLKPTNT